VTTPSESAPLLADDFWRISHHYWKGKAHLNDRVLSLGLAAALLIELYDAGYIGFQPSNLLGYAGTDDEDDNVIVLPRFSLPSDLLGRQILGRIGGEEFPLATRLWLAYLARDAQDKVCRRMFQAGHLVRGRAVFWRRRRYLPANLNDFGRAEAVLSQRLRKGEPLGYHEQCLAAVAQATRLHAVTLKDAPPGVFAAARFWAGQLPPELRQLMGQVETAVAASVLSQTA
jgi:hypothetical protein